MAPFNDVPEQFPFFEFDDLVLLGNPRADYVNAAITNPWVIDNSFHDRM